MNITELSKLDIKDIKALISGAQMQDIWRNKALVFNMLLIAATVSFVVWSLNSRGNETKKLHKKITGLEDKLTAISQQNDVTQQLNNFIEEFPQPLESDRIINVLTDLAEKRHIQINSISPLRTTARQLYTQTNLDLALWAPNFQDLGLFIRDIEKYGFTLHAESYAGSSNLSSPQQNEQYALQGTITVGLIQLKK